jgi:hypothetical protein
MFEESLGAAGLESPRSARLLYAGTADEVVALAKSFRTVPRTNSSSMLLETHR